MTVPRAEQHYNVVTVDLGRGYSLLYAHLSSSQVVPGQWLATGDPIGLGPRPKQHFTRRIDYIRRRFPMLRTRGFMVSATTRAVTAIAT